MSNESRTLEPEKIVCNYRTAIPIGARVVRCSWTPYPFPVVFHAQHGHPGQVSYEIYVPSSAHVSGHALNNFVANESNRRHLGG